MHFSAVYRLRNGVPPLGGVKQGRGAVKLAIFWL